MAITLDQFRTISNGTHNVGQIMLNDDGDGLQKINNHVWQTSKNNVQTIAYQNRAVRQALYDAFSSSGKLSPAMLNDIKTILLGGTNGSRSLSRDFVKKLFDTVDHAHEGDDIVSMMNVVSKSLSERKVSVVKNDLVTSSKGAAYEIYASEKMDICAREGREGFQAIKAFSEAVGVGQRLTPEEMENLSSAVKKMMKSLFDMIMGDKYLVGVKIPGNYHFMLQENRAIVSERIDKINADRLLFLPGGCSCIDSVGSFVTQFRQEVSKAYANLGIPDDIFDDHLARILPPEFIPGSM